MGQGKGRAGRSVPAARALARLLCRCGKFAIACPWVSLRTARALRWIRSRDKGKRHLHRALPPRPGEKGLAAQGSDRGYAIPLSPAELLLLRHRAAEGRRGLQLRSQPLCPVPSRKRAPRVPAAARRPADRRGGSQCSRRLPTGAVAGCGGSVLRPVPSLSSSGGGSSQSRAALRPPRAAP